MARILVTGAAGFIGAAVAQALLARGDTVLGIDNLNSYYDVRLKQARLARLQGDARFEFRVLDIADRPAMDGLALSGPFDGVVHLAAQAGVRYSVTHPAAYLDSNLLGFGHVLELARRCAVKHLVFASSSSVYGANARLPFSEHDNVDHPVSLYAATKKANELMAHSYAWVHRLPCTGLRFFTVYGPWGRPDMALFIFAKNMLAGLPIDVFNHGQHRRDFTYIDDIVTGIVGALDRPPSPNPQFDPASPDPSSSLAPYKIYNIGNHRSVELMRYIGLLEECLGIKAQMNLLPLQNGDVPATWADIEDLSRDTGYSPTTPVEVGVERFVRWYLQYYGRP